MPVDIGDFYPIRVETRAEPDPGQDEGDLTDTGSVTVTITDLTTGLAGTPTPMTRTSVGTYDYDAPCPVAGLFRWDAIAVGTIEGAWGDVFTVTDSAGVFISVDEALLHMRATDTITEPDQLEQLRWLCQVSCDAVERASGRTMARRTITEPYDGGRDHIRLRKGPILSVTSVTENGIVVPPTGWVLDQRHDRLYRGTTFGSWCWEPGLLNVVPTIVAGYTVVPLIARHVGLRGIARMWQSSQQMPMQYIDDEQANEVVVTTVTNLGPLEMQAWMSLQKVRQA